MTLPEKINIRGAALPASYEAAKQALAKCSSIDECKDWSDKAGALASYAKQADDDQLEQYAMRIKARAIRRCGELLKQVDGRGNYSESESGGAPTFTQRQMAEQAGMSKDQQVQAVRVANIPGNQFNDAVEAGDTTITGLAAMGKKPAPHNPYPDAPPAPPGFIQATEAIGTVKMFAEFCQGNDPVNVAGGVMEYETDDIREHISTIDKWLDRFIVNLKGKSNE